eukprot:15904959-Heterocapsa_arctica.AAC.1
MKTYIKYIKNPLVKEDAEKHTNIKGTKTGAVGRPTILPEQLGHEVQTASTAKGEYEYCLKCGKYTKAKHIETAKHIFWRRDICKPVLRLRQYLDKQHTMGFDEWWHCTKCEARGPELNN